MRPVPVLELRSSPLARARPVSIAYRDLGTGPVVLFLHGGWGHDVYPVDPAPLAGRRLVIPTRTGYGQSTPLDVFPPDFHRRAVDETAAVLDALGVPEAVWWGHSDGAVIAALAAIHTPERVQALVLEAVHFDPAKPASRTFFERMVDDPDGFGERIAGILAAEHGAHRWRQVLRADGQAWLDLAARAPTLGDVYEGRLGEVAAPVLLVHGARDPRTEPGELDAIRAALPHAVVAVQPEGGHSPHSERRTAPAVMNAIEAFIERLPSTRPAPPAVIPRRS